MYQIDPETNELVELDSKRFSDLGFKEREHLQEWIAKSPESRGAALEELCGVEEAFSIEPK